jgi:hypothetical protein
MKNRWIARIFTEIEELLELMVETTKRMPGLFRGVKKRNGNPLTFLKGEYQVRSLVRQVSWLPQTLHSSKKASAFMPMPC